MIRVFLLTILFFLANISAKTQSWYMVNAPFNTLASLSVYELKTIDSLLYIGGGFHMYIGGTETYSIAKWNGLQWDSLGIGTGVNPQWGNYVGGEIYSIKKYNGEIYAGGAFRHAGYFIAPKIAKWNGTSWDSVNTVWNAPGPAVYSLELFENKLHIGGVGLVVKDSIGNNLNIGSMGRWSGTNWEVMPAGTPNGSVNSMIIFNNELYVSGSFGAAGGVPVYNLARWDGVQWKPCGLGSTGPTGTMVVDTINKKLYVLSDIYVVNSDSVPILTNGVSRWNGEKWEDIPPHYYIGKISLEIYHGELYVGAVQNPVLSKFDGKTWKGVDYLNNTVLALEVYKDTLFAGGFFDTIIESDGDTIYSPGLARYWTPNYCDSIHSPFTILEDTVYLSDSAIAQFIPTGFANQYEWDFQDSSIKDTAQFPKHYYDTAGVFNVKLRATYGLCPWDSAVKTVVVIDDCLPTTITAPDTAYKDSIVQFTGNNSQATQWNWLFAGNTIGNTQTENFGFSNAGTYTITLVTHYKYCIDTAVKTIVVIDAVGIKELAAGSRQLKVYPNPAGESFIVEVSSPKSQIPNPKLEILDVNGKLVKELAVGSGSRQYLIETKGWAKGVYFVNLVSENKIVAKEKVVVQ